MTGFLAVAGALVVVVAASAGGALLWVRGNLTVVRVLGPSMSPSCSDGEAVLARRVRPQRLRTGDVVVLRPPGGPAAGSGGTAGLPVIKRVAALPGEAVPASFRSRTPEAQGVAGTVPDGSMLVLGDNADSSIDSRDYGYVELGAVEGRVLRGLRTGVAGAPSTDRRRPNAPWPGSSAAAASTDATNAYPPDSSPSPASSAPHLLLRTQDDTR